MKNNVPRVVAHPITYKSIKNSHPWVTKDKYSLNFPKAPLIEIYHFKEKKSYGYFLHDPKHPRIKARFWSESYDPDLKKVIIKRLNDSMAKRKSLNLQRENYYLVFGEVDQLPGLTILLLNQVILIQYHAYFWEPYLEFLITNLTRKLPQIQSVYSQKRVVGENKTKPQHVWGDITDRFQVKESDISFNIRFDDNYDIGLYSDMSSFREKLKTLFKENFTCLNLFAYTGAFSLMALKNKMRTYSVDVSKKYLLWLEENITSNKFAADLHQSITKSCDKYIQRALDEKKNFDLIISDPPSFSSDGKKSKSSFDFYQENLDHLISLLSEKGHLVLFLNTHKIERKKFKKMLTDKIQTQPQIKLIQELYLDQDCAIMKKFPESDYLKGYVLKKN